ncbi:MAG: 16S rRNA (uracil(1498)-N(3))-methyltransferase [Alphaproteobacteria bacterium]|nr:16S rRNA (uracil(1498)-N(3))-methyltransferase [Alphaproteobacteria bacterium]
MDAALKRTPRVYVEHALAAGKDVALDKALSHYLGNVMRLKAGDTVRMFNGQDGEWLCTIHELTKRCCSLRADSQTRQQISLPDIHYLFAPLKHARLDYMAQKATELGAALLQPVLTEYTNVSRIKLERMRANAIEAAEQCNLLSIPGVREPERLGAILDDWDPLRRLIFCDEAAAVSSPLTVLQGLPSGPVALLIGPEGGFSPAERGRLLDQPFVTTISLGPRVMRADTAGTAAMALVQAALGDWR